MRILTEAEKKYGSLIFHTESANADMKNIANHYKFNYKSGIINPVVIISAAVLLILGFVFIGKSLPAGISCLILGILLGGLSVFLVLKGNAKKKKEFFQYYENAIIQNGKINHPDMKSVSALFPVYLGFDNELKAVTLNYQEQIRIFCEYDDILNYSVYAGTEEKEDAILETAEKAEEYSLLITFNNKKTAKISFSNKINKFTVNRNNDYLRNSNKEALNKIADVFHQIISKNVVK